MLWGRPGSGRMRPMPDRAFVVFSLPSRRGEGGEMNAWIVLGAVVLFIATVLSLLFVVTEFLNSAADREVNLDD